MRLALVLLGMLLGAPQRSDVAAIDALTARTAAAPDDVDAHVDLAQALYRARYLSRTSEALDRLAALLQRRAAQAVPTAAPADGIRRAGVDAEYPTKTKHVQPDYPQGAFRARRQGVVVLDFLVGPDGRVSDVAVVRGVDGLDDAAVRAVRGWRYAPLTVDRKPVPVRLTTAVTFAFCGPIDAEGAFELVRHFARVGLHADAVRAAASAAETVRDEAAWGFRAGAKPVGNVDELPTGRITAPRRIKNVPPVYPAAAQAARLSGFIKIEALIDRAGNVSRARVVQCEAPLLDDAALTAVRQWKYSPAMMNGQPVEVLMTVRVTFSLN